MKWLPFGLVLWVQGSLLSPDLMRLPALFLHFHQHRTEHPGLGLLTFLSAHYGEEAELDHDHPGHGSLPFHHHHHDATADHCGIKLISGDPPAAVSFPEETNRRAHVPLPDDGLSAGFRRALLQPPRPLA